MRGTIRESGLETVGDVPWGTHFCQFYHTAADLVDILVPYFQAGLAADEYCMWVTSAPLVAAEARAALAAAVPDLDERVARGQLEIIPHTQWYLAGGRFEAERVLGGWVERLAGARDRGFAGLRLSGNTFWLERADWRDFAEYEARINDVIGRCEMLALCTYALDRCDAAEVIDVVRNHQFALIKQDGRWQLIESSERKRAAEERERLVEELRRVNAELRSLERAREEHLQAIGHDLRAPLAAILGHTQLLLRRADPPEQVRQTGEVIARNARRLNTMIGELVDSGRLEAGQYRLAPQPVDVVAAALDVRSRLGEAGGAERVAVAAAGSDGPVPPVLADPDALDRVLSNLVSNALKYSAPETPVAVTVAGRGREVVVSVADRGEGIPPDELPHLFERYRRIGRVGGSRQRQEGLGLGLYITRCLVEAQGGRIWAESAPARGSTFAFALPVAGAS